MIWSGLAGWGVVWGTDRDRINIRWPDFASSLRQESRGASGENNASPRNAISSFASRQIHSEVNLDMAFLTQQTVGRGGVWPGEGLGFCGAPTAAPRVLSE